MLASILNTISLEQLELIKRLPKNADPLWKQEKVKKKIVSAIHNIIR